MRTGFVNHHSAGVWTAKGASGALPDNLQLTVRSTSDDFSTFGQSVILFLIQSGGIGIIAVTTYIAFSAVATRWPTTAVGSGRRTLYQR